MLVLFETAAGYALFKAKDGKIKKDEDLSSLFATPEIAASTVKLQGFHKFVDTADALNAATATTEGKVSKPLKKFLTTAIVEAGLKETLAVADAKLGSAIKEKLGIMCQYDTAVAELMRGIRAHMSSLISGLRPEDMSAMSLGLSHSLSRYKLKFSPDKVDTMIVQAISLLDDLDKELNTYSMRVREWYGWHFPELTKIITDNSAYARTVLAAGFRQNISKTSLSTILPEEIEAEVKEAAEISMGTEISDSDLANIKHLAEQVIAISEYRAELYDYLKNRMNAIAPNVTIMVGELVGARLIAHAGSLLSLAKHPASTVQILGAEKALFRALKTKHDTPKYGLLYHASVVGQSGAKNKGKMSRVLAAKTSLVARVDALADQPDATIGLEYRAKVDARLRQLEGGAAVRVSRPASAVTPAAVVPTTPKSYNPDADSTLTASKKKKKEKDEDSPDKKEKKKDKKKEKDSGDKRKADDEDGPAPKTPKSDKKEKKAKKSKNDDE